MIELTDNELFKNSQGALFEIIKRLNGKVLYKIIDKDNKLVGAILAVVIVIDDDHTIVRADFFMGRSEPIGSTGFVEIATGEPWQEALELAIVYALTDTLQNELYAHFNINIPYKINNEDFTLSEVLSAFEKAGYTIVKVLESMSNGNILGEDLSELARVMGIDLTFSEED